MIDKIYVYEGNSFNPYINLATEKYLFDELDKNSVILYLWQNENTIVIGNNQNPWAECLAEEMKKDNIFLARRLSGGGAVFHDLGNLNFTFILNTEDYDLEKQMRVIKTACELSEIPTEISGRNDILADGKKFSGNAFYNSKGKSYHHGTIMVSCNLEKMTKYLTPPKAKLTAKGVKSVKSRVINLSSLSHNLTIEKMKENMKVAFEKTYGLNAEILPPVTNKCILDLAEKYKSWEYLYGFNMPFTFSFEGQFDWGHIELCLDIKKGIIQNIKVYTDSMNWTLSENIEKSLIGCQFDADVIKNTLKQNFSSKESEDIILLISENLGKKKE